jgi:uncharacterized membrane protein YdjX (TVP38/TMEM64 family)
MTDLDRQTMLRKLGPAGLLGIVWTVMPAVFGVLLLANLGTLSDWLRADLTIGLAVYVCIFVLSAGFGLLPTYAQALLGGWVFGTWLGFSAALAGFTGAAVLGYVIARTVSRDRIEDVIERDLRARAIRDALVGRGFWRTLLIVSLLRVPPNSPFALTNLVMASTGVGKRAYVLGTSIGMAPRTFIAALIAAQAAATGSRDLQELARSAGWTVMIGGLVVMIIVLAIIGVIANHALERVGVSLRGPRRPDTPAPDGNSDSPDSTDT